MVLPMDSTISKTETQIRFIFVHFSSLSSSYNLFDPLREHAATFRAHAHRQQLAYFPIMHIFQKCSKGIHVALIVSFSAVSLPLVLVALLSL